jgi:hypothetical protein
LCPRLIGADRLNTRDLRQTRLPAECRYAP